MMVTREEREEWEVENVVTKDPPLIWEKEGCCRLQEKWETTKRVRVSAEESIVHQNCLVRVVSNLHLLGVEEEVGVAFSSCLCLWICPCSSLLLLLLLLFVSCRQSFTGLLWG